MSPSAFYVLARCLPDKEWQRHKWEEAPQGTNKPNGREQMITLIIYTLFLLLIIGGAIAVWRMER
jgi:hypothetical protein